MESINPAQPDVTADNTARMLEIRWPDGETCEFHYVWLRHSGRAPHGMANDTSVKIDLLPDDPAELEVGQFSIRNDILVVAWKNDGTETHHGLTNLRQSGYDSRSRARRKRKPQLWGKSGDQVPMLDFAGLGEQDYQFELLSAVRDFGLARIRNVPAEPGAIARVADIFGPVHVNNYGTIFDVQTSTNTTLGSNTGAYLGPHTDESYRHAPPGISLFHCLAAAQSGGGESILVDGFHAAEKLRVIDPDSFEILSTVPIFFQRLALPDEDMQAHGKVITTNIDGDVEGIRFTDRTIPPQDLPPRFVEPTYKALKAFWNIVNLEELKFQYLMRPGDLHVFDNHRVLHGRTDFDPAVSHRHLQQCSVNRDEFHNTLRLMAQKFCSSEAREILPGGALG